MKCSWQWMGFSFSFDWLYLSYDLLFLSYMFIVLRESFWICRSPILEIEDKEFASITLLANRWTFGVPQGSILGPLFFYLFWCDLFLNTGHCTDFKIANVLIRLEPVAIEGRWIQKKTSYLKTITDKFPNITGRCQH